MMHDRTFGGKRARRLKVVSINPAQMTAEQKERMQRDCRTFDEKMQAIRAHYLARAMEKAGTDSPWYGLRVAFGRETAVESVLKQHEIESLVPMRMGRERRVRHRIVPARPEPAITGYVLVRFAVTAEACLGLMGIEHVVGLVSVDGKPMPMNHEEVMKFKAKADDGELDWAHDSGVVYSAGERVRITDGPFGGFPGAVVSARADGRGDAVVEIDLFGRPTPVTVPLAILEKM